MSRRLKIVVADDEIDTREYLQESLSRLGHDVRAAEDGRQLVEICRRFGPDLVVTDYAMPGLDGVSAAAEVNRERRVPVILITGRHDVTPPDGGGHVVACLSKPVKADVLKAAVENATQGEPRPPPRAATRTGLSSMQGRPAVANARASPLSRRTKAATGWAANPPEQQQEQDFRRCKDCWQPFGCHVQALAQAGPPVAVGTGWKPP